MRNTKIIATIGPASNSEAVIRDLIAAGVDVCRLNFSHGTHETHKTTIDRIRAAAASASRHVAILQDLSGPRSAPANCRTDARWRLPRAMSCGSRWETSSAAPAGCPRPTRT
jgi:pyruvate kinase